MRRSKILEVATELFSKNGMSFTTRDLANAVGVTQPLIFQHFETKEDLVDAIYLEQFENLFDDAWISDLEDRSVSLYQRLVRFYEKYTEVVFEEKWMRVYFWSALEGAEINKRYTRFVAEHITKPIAVEVAWDVRRARSGETYAVDGVTDAEFEAIYTAHSGLLYFGMRKYLFQDAPDIDRTQIIHDCVASMLHGAPSVVQTYLSRSLGAAPPY
ncbi:TetR/AcrR family transcriptional regulator [Salinihabitans flavidus]|uniref:TetR/AcrR family transcriptional regulator n=1 Tax=Salinihabitans flavidus TaxID=569882 RepID=UPI001587920E|nr:TetR/AcrR family transcriptional regulator [Salinihabitans flavidus]